MTAERMTGGQALARQLVREGVAHVFGLPGDQTMHAIDGLYDEPSIQFVTTRHEQGTTYMADGYARGGGRPGVAFVVPGVGVYNAGAGLATAFAASSPVVLIAGQINRDGIGQGLGLLHEIDDQLDLVRPITVVAAACAHRRRDPRRRARGVRACAARPPAAGRDRDAAGSVLGRRPRSRCSTGPTTCASPPTPSRSRAAARALAGAERPLIWAGGGVVLGDASPALTAVAEHLQAPVVTTRQGKGAIDDRHPLSAGTIWVNRRMQPLLDDADVILAVGTHFLGNKLAAEKTVVHLDVDATEIGRHFANPIPVVGDAAPSLELLLDALRRQRDPAPSRADEMQAFRKQVEEDLRAVGPQGLMVDQLRAAIPDDGVLVPVHHHDRLHVPHALPGLRAAHLPVDLVHGHARVGLPRRAGREGRPARRAGRVRDRRRRVPVRRHRARHRGAVRHQHRHRGVRRRARTATPTATSASASTAARSAPSCATPTS